MAQRICTIDGCDRKHRAGGLCQLHYDRMRRCGTTDPNLAFNDGLPRKARQPEVCEIETCDRPANVPGAGRGWCQAHYRRWQNWGDVFAPVRKARSRVGDTCKVCGIVLISNGAALGYCALHYSRLLRTGSTDDPIPYERPICSEPNCDDVVNGRGLCKRHYDQQYRPDRFDQWRQKEAEKYSPEELAEQARHRAKRRRAIIRGAKEHHTHKEWVVKLAECGGRCVYCGAPADTKDHDVPLVRGGSDVIGNIVPACRSCNSRKRTRTGAEWRAILAEEGQDNGEEENPCSEYESA